MKGKRVFASLLVSACVALGAAGGITAFAADDSQIVYNPDDWNFYRKTADPSIEMTTEVNNDGLFVSAIGTAEAIGMNWLEKTDFSDFSFEVRLDDLITDGAAKQNVFFFGFYDESGNYWGTSHNSVSFSVDLTGKTLPAEGATVNAALTVRYKKEGTDTASNLVPGGVDIDDTHTLTFTSSADGMVLNGKDITLDTNWWAESQRSFFESKQAYFGIHTWAKDETPETMDDAVALTILSLDGKKIVAGESGEPEEPAIPIEYTSTDFSMFHQDGSMEKYQTLTVDEDGVRVEGKNPIAVMSTNLAYLGKLDVADVYSTIKVNKAYPTIGMDYNAYFFTFGVDPNKKFDATKSIAVRFEFPANFTALPTGDEIVNLTAIVTLNSEGRNTNPWEVDEYAVSFPMNASHEVTVALKDGRLSINGVDASGENVSGALDSIANFIKEAKDGVYLNWFSQVGDPTGQNKDRYGSETSFTVTNICGRKIVNEVPEAQKITVKPVLSDITANSMKITWTKAELTGADAKFQATSYLINRYKGAGSTPEKIITIDDPDTLSFVDTGLEAETRYVYEVVAIYGEGDDAIEIAEYSRVNAVTLESQEEPAPGPGDDNNNEEPTGGCGGSFEGVASVALAGSLVLAGAAVLVIKRKSR